MFQKHIAVTDGNEDESEAEKKKASMRTLH